MSNELYQRYEGKNQAQINNDFAVACASGNLKDVQYLLTSDQIPFKADVEWGNYSGIIWASMNNRVEVAKYLFTSEDLKEKLAVDLREDSIFRMALYNGAHDVLNYLINDLHMQRTEQIALIINNNPDLIVEKMFLNRELQDNLQTNTTKTKKPKL